MMRKILNDPTHFVDDMLAGILAAHPSELRAVADDAHALVRANAPLHGKVGIATGGGSGHLPLFLGYVGDGMLDGVAVGDVFASPSAEQMLAVTEQIDGGAGVLYLYGNYGGDVFNFDLAAELAQANGIRVETVLGADDVASAPSSAAQRRRGIAGIFFLYKVAGAAAAAGADLDAVVKATRWAAENTRTMGVALSPCTLPAVGQPTFELPAGEMEIGMGIHGEPGIRRGPLLTSDEIVDELFEPLAVDLSLARGDRVAVLVNGLGSTPKEELYIMYGRLHALLADRGVSVHRCYVGEFATSLEMAGASLSLLRCDRQLQQLIDAPANTPFFVQA